MSDDAQHPTSETERHVLANELARALDEVVNRTGCKSTYRLWAEATQSTRERIFGGTSLGVRLAAVVPMMSAPSRSKYRALAAWRHAVIWRGALEHIQPVDRERLAVSGIWFTRVAVDATPFSWSKKTSSAPHVHHFAGPAEMRDLAKSGCWQSVEFLRKHAEDLVAARDTSRAALLQECVLSRESLSDVLGIDHLWRKA